MSSYVLVDHVFDETSSLKDLYDEIIKHVVISAMQGINGKTFRPVSMMKSLDSNCPSSPLRNCVCVRADFQWEDTHNDREWT